MLEATVGLCPHCLSRLDGTILSRDGQVYVSRCCPEHGEQLDLLEEDREYFLARRLYANAPTPCPVQTTHREGCPFDCGLCPEHQQHTCIALIEITDACDLHCPVCYAGSEGDSFLALDTFKRMLDFALESEGGKLDILQLSGGEPTLHPQLQEMLVAARERGVQYVLLNTNGLSLLQNPELAQKLAQFKDRFELYLQFDGFSEAPHAALRGQPLAGLKRQVLEKLSEHGIPTTLVMSVAAGINDQEIGATVARALQVPFVRGASFQPVAYFGRMPVSQPERTRRATLSGVIRRLTAQMNGMIRPEHIIPLPCDPERVAIGYFHKPAPGSFVPMLTRQEALANLAQVPNTLRFRPEEMVGLLPNPVCCGPSCCGALAQKIQQFFPRSFFSSRNALDKARMVSETTFRITVTSFVDAYNFDLRSCQRECVHVITPDLKKIPFSAYNLYHRARRTGL